MCLKSAGFIIEFENGFKVCHLGDTGLFGDMSMISSYCQSDLVVMKFSGAKQDCVPCQRRKECLRTPEKTQTRQVSFFQGIRDKTESHVDQMKAKIDSEKGKDR